MKIKEIKIAWSDCYLAKDDELVGEVDFRCELTLELEGESLGHAYSEAIAAMRFCLLANAQTDEVSE